MIFFITMLTLSVVASIAFIILGLKTYKRKKRNRKIININEHTRKNDNRLMLISVIGGLFSVLATMYTLLNSVPSPTIYPLNNDARVYNGTAEVIIESYPIFSIYYSLDGSDPKDGKIYKDSFTLTETTTVVAKNRFLHFFWSEPSKSTYRFESTQNITVNSVDNNSDDRMAEFFAYAIIFFIFGTMFFNAVHGK